MNPETAPLVQNLDRFSVWRASLASRLKALQSLLGSSGLLEVEAGAPLRSIISALDADRLVMLCVAEFSRGKSELVNAIFFAQHGQRVLPASPGRTTMCPVELGYEPGVEPMLALLPIETRLDPESLHELRQDQSRWHFIKLDLSQPAAMTESLAELTRTQFVSRNQAEALGFWDEADQARSAPLRDDGLVEVPLWRHALVNYPHPLLAKGLVVLDTPGLNAVGTEAELTLGLLPMAQVVMFVLAADAGVSQSDLTIWRDHLGASQARSFVVLNKVDVLRDPLSSAQAIEDQIRRQVQNSSALLEVEPRRIFPLSARSALTARIQGDDAQLQESGLLALEHALVSELLPERRRILAHKVEATLKPLSHQLRRHMQDHRRQLIEQMEELRGLRGKSDTKVRMMLQRLNMEAQDFERCNAQWLAVRAVHARMMRSMVAGLSSDRVREEVERLQIALSAFMKNFGARRVWMQCCERLRDSLQTSVTRNGEIRDMLEASFVRLNNEFGFALHTSSPPDLRQQVQGLDEIAANVNQALGLSQILRLNQPMAVEQFRRTLVTRLRTVFESACAEFEIWNQQALAQMDGQMRERRQSFRQRRDSIERIRDASLDLDKRMSELQAQAGQWELHAETFEQHIVGIEKVLSATLQLKEDRG
jgi:hypothetical protein